MQCDESCGNDRVTVSVGRSTRQLRRAAALAAGVCALIGAGGGFTPAGAQRAGPGERPTSLPAVLAQIAEIEDGRGRHSRQISELFDLAKHASPVVRAAAYRALGRQQDAALLGRIYPALHDRAPVVRREGTNAIGQALQAHRGVLSSAARASLVAAIDSLRHYAARPNTASAEAGLAARTIGRLPYADSATARLGEGAMVDIGRVAAGSVVRLEGVLHGLYAVARQRRTLGDLGTGARELMLAASRRSVPDAAPTARLRRLAVLGLTAAGAIDAEAVNRAAADGDEQVRRLAVIAQASLGDSTKRREVIQRALHDRSAMVRHEGVRGLRPFVSTDGCKDLTDAVGDANAHVVLAAIDGLSASCRDRDRATEALLGMIDANRSDSPNRAPGRSGWHIHAHALIALARTAPDRAKPVVRRDAASPLWTVRWYVARAARLLTDTATLVLLADDSDGNVRQTAIEGLSAVVGHLGDAQYLRALGAAEHHVIMGAAGALKGSADRSGNSNALFAALDRLTGERRENSRDARVALLDRVAELGSPALAPRLDVYRSDYDSTVARRAASILSTWKGERIEATPALPPPQREDIVPLLSGTWRARITMSAATGGGTFEVELHAREAPYTVARFVRLARSGFYNGRTFHRVEPGFVIQGGSPAANEYVGDGPFMRDEVGERSHLRGTLGISTRGRDTGDGQLFVNLTDNFRLDHDYTVFGTIVRGRDVAEQVLEADVIERIDIVKAR